MVPWKVFERNGPASASISSRVATSAESVGLSVGLSVGFGGCDEDTGIDTWRGAVVSGVMLMRSVRCW